MTHPSKGNQYWKLRSTHGRKPIFASAEDLWEACVKYFQWVEDNPLIENKLVTYQGDSKLEEVPRMRAMTQAGMCIYLDIHQDTWRGYRERPGFLDVTTRVDDIIRTQKFEGAAAELLNPQIIARDLGLRDQHDHTTGGEILPAPPDGEDLARKIAFIFAQSMETEK